MTKQKPIEVVTPPNMLKVKVGGKLAPLDPDAIARAEAALEGLSGQFADWMNEELEQLDAAFKAVQPVGLMTDEGEAFYRRVHDLKGLGTTYEFPIVTEIAAVVCKLMENETARASAPMPLVAAHVHAIRAAVRDDIRSSDHPVGRVLLTELQSQVVALLGDA